MNSLLTQSRDGKTVLVVDDDATVAAFAGEVLAQGGYNVKVATDERAAVAAAKDVHIDLLLSDVVVGSAFDGLDIQDSVRSIQPGVRVLFMSGYGPLRFPNTAMENFLQKPFSPAQLLATVELALAP